MKGFWKVQWWFSWVLKDVSVVLRQVACEEKAGEGLAFGCGSTVCHCWSEQDDDGQYSILFLEGGSG